MLTQLFPTLACFFESCSQATTAVTVRDLKPRTAYFLRVIAYNELGNPSEVRLFVCVLVGVYGLQNLGVNARTCIVTQASTPLLVTTGSAKTTVKCTPRTAGRLFMMQQ